MKKLNIVKENVSMVFDGENKIYITKPTENQTKILECENTIELIEKEIDKANKQIKENQKEIDDCKGKEVASVIGFTLAGFITGSIIKLVTGVDTLTNFNLDIALLSTLVTVPVSIYTASIITTLRKLNINNNRKLRREKNGYKKLLETKEAELSVLKRFDKKINNNCEKIEFVDTTRQTTIEQLKKIKEFYSTDPKSKYEFIGINLENNGVLTLKKEKNKSKK